MFERLHIVSRAFCQRFNRTVGTVSHVTNYLMSRGRALRKESISNALYVTTDQKLPRHQRLHIYFSRACQMVFAL
jgi:hypothetical protein